jgi:DNA gyrase/topoisomerase IV subunit A
MKPKEKATLVQEMLGLDLGKFDDEYKRVFAERTDLGRDGKKLASQLEGLKRHEGAPAEEVRVADLMAELDGLKDKEKQRQDLERKIEEIKSEQEDINEEERKLMKSIADLQSRLDYSKLLYAKSEESLEKAKKEFSEAPDVASDITSVKQKISDADSVNEKVRANKKHDEVEAELKKSRGDWQKLTDKLKAIQDMRAEEVANAEWPMEGMELNEDGLLMNGLPFEQASTSQRIMASVKVGMALNPKLRLLVCQHGSDLDNDTLDALESVVKENDFQLIIELVTRTDADAERCAVIIEDGRVVGAEEELETEDE